FSKFFALSRRSGAPNLLLRRTAKHVCIAAAVPRSSTLQRVQGDGPMSAGIDIPQLDPVAPAVPPLRHVKLDRLVNMAVERTREGMRARHQQLHVEAMAAPIVVCGDRDTLAEALARLLDTASNAAGEGGVVTLSVSQIGLNATLKVGVCRQMAGASDSDTDCDWTAVERLIEAHGGTVSARTHAEG